MRTKDFSKALGEINDKYIAEAAEYQAKPKKTSVFASFRKISLVACICLVFTFGTTMALSSEVRDSVFGWVRQQYHSFYEYSFVSYDKAEQKEPETNSDMKVAGNSNDTMSRHEYAVADEAELKYEITWLPEGTEFVTSFDNGDGETFIYTNEREMVIQFTYTTGMNSKLFVGAENYEERKATVNGMDADIYISPTDDETSAIVWKDNSIPMLFNFSADCSPEELIKAAESVRVKE